MRLNEIALSTIYEFLSIIYSDYLSAATHILVILQLLSLNAKSPKFIDLTDADYSVKSFTQQETQLCRKETAEWFILFSYLVTHENTECFPVVTLQMYFLPLCASYIKLIFLYPVLIWITLHGVKQIFRIT